MSGERGRSTATQTLIATAVEYSGALLVVGWLWLRGGQRPRRLTVAGALVAILVLVLDLLGSVDLSFVGVLWGPGAAVGLAVSFVVSATTDDGLPAGATKAQVG